MSPLQPDSTGSSARVNVDFSVDAPLADARWDEARIRPLVEEIVRHHFSPAGGDFHISLHLVDDQGIRALNAEHRGKDAHTDVLSFPLHDPDGARFVVPPNQPANLGDVVISYPRAQEQAREYGHSVDREIGYLVAHGVLHVLGHDHEDAADRRRMRQREEEALGSLGLTR
jgi:probable rRNA maturation factor